MQRDWPSWLVPETPPKRRRPLPQPKAVAGVPNPSLPPNLHDAPTTPSPRAIARIIDNSSLQTPPPVSPGTRRFQAAMRAACSTPSSASSLQTLRLSPTVQIRRMDARRDRARQSATRARAKAKASASSSTVLAAKATPKPKATMPKPKAKAVAKAAKAKPQAKAKATAVSISSDSNESSD